MSIAASRGADRPAAAGTRGWTYSRLMAGTPFAAVIVLAFVLSAVQPINHDVAWTLIAGGRLLDGAVFGRDIVDLNLPWIYYISAAAVAFARLFHATDILSLTGLIVLVASISAGIIRRVLHTVHVDDAGFRYACVFAFFAVALLAPGQDFAQREQLIFILMAPYVVAVACRSTHGLVGKFEGVIIGLLGGAALMVKPHWVLLPVMLEIWLLVRTRRVRALLRTESVTLAVAGTAGLASTLWLAPLYSSAMVPLALETYWAYDHTFAWGFLTLVYIPVAFGWAAAFLMRDSRAFQPLVWATLVTIMAGTIVVVVQGKFFEYHALPVRCAGLWAGLTAVLYGFASRLGNEQSGRADLPGPPAVISIVLACTFVLLRWASYTDVNRGDLAVFETALRREGPVPSLYAFSTSIPPAFPLVNQLGASWPGRLQCLWPLPAVVRPGPLPPERRAAIGEWLVRSVVEDLAAAPPAVILVQTTPAKQALGNQPFEYIPWFSRDSKFRRLWNNYELRDQVATQEEHYQIWRLRPN